MSILTLGFREVAQPRPAHVKLADWTKYKDLGERSLKHRLFQRHQTIVPKLKERRQGWENTGFFNKLYELQQ